MLTYRPKPKLAYYWNTKMCVRINFYSFKNKKYLKTWCGVCYFNLWALLIIIKLWKLFFNYLWKRFLFYKFVISRSAKVGEYLWEEWVYLEAADGVVSWVLQGLLLLPWPVTWPWACCACSVEEAGRGSPQPAGLPASRTAAKIG